MRANDANNVKLLKEGQLLRGRPQLLLLLIWCCATFTVAAIRLALFYLVSLLVGPLLDNHLANVAVAERDRANPSAIKLGDL